MFPVLTVISKGFKKYIVMSIQPRAWERSNKYYTSITLKEEKVQKRSTNLAKQNFKF